VMSASIPKAFAERGLAFAAAYVCMQLGRTLFFLWAVRAEAVNVRRNFQRILVWLSLSALFWNAGGWPKTACAWRSGPRRWASK
jgi:low temperature requirement protein LtrA